MEIADETFKHFRTFLMKNGLYKDFMECFRKQKYGMYGHEIDIPTQPLPNYKIAIREYANSKRNSYSGFGAMIFTFASFNWVNGGHVPLPFTKKWCTTNLKWGVYCKLNNIEICDDAELKRLIVYWDNQGWIDPYRLSREERIFIKNMFEIERLSMVNIINEID